MEDNNSNLQNEIKKIYDKQLLDFSSDSEDSEEINVDDYELAEEESEFGIYVGLLNIFTCYFKQLFRRQQDETMFDHTDNSKDSTNRCMEFMYEQINKYNSSEESDKDLL